MILYPAIDLKDGVCVRVLHGDLGKATVFNTSPADQAQAFARDGFHWIHCVDLNGAVEGKPVNLTGKEYQILELLSLRKGTTLTKEMFLNHLYGGMDEPELKIIDVFICKLRKKLSEAIGGESHIETVWGRGYVLREPAPNAERLAIGA